MSTSRPGRRSGRSRKSPRIPSPRGYKGIRLVTRDDVVSQRRKLGSAFLSVTKKCVIFIASNFESRASEVGLHKQKKDTASAKEGKVSLLRSGGQSCSYWSYTLHAIVECGSAFIEDISKAGMKMSVNYPLLFTYMVIILM